MIPGIRSSKLTTWDSVVRAVSVYRPCRALQRWFPWEDNIIRMQSSIVFVDLKTWVSPIPSPMEGGEDSVPPQKEPVIRAAEVPVCDVPSRIGMWLAPLPQEGLANFSRLELCVGLSSVNTVPLHCTQPLRGSIRTARARRPIFWWPRKKWLI